MNVKPIKTLICSCCGQHTKGRQWWNQDTGYGMCSKCIESVEKHRNYQDREYLKQTYGIENVHYFKEAS